MDHTSAGSKLREAIKDLGWGDGLLYMCSRALEAASGGRARVIKYHFVAQPVPENALSTGRAVANTVISRAAPDDPIVERFPRPRAVIERRYAEGAVCFVARTRSDELAGFIWIKQHQYMEDEVRCLYVLDPEGAAAWDFDVWLAPEFRLTRTFARLWDAANAYLRERGYRWTISRISAWNPASLAAHRRLGMQRLHSAVFIALGPLQLAVLTCAPYLHVALSRRRYPVLRLRGPEGPGRAVGGETAPSR
jgi:hypothetical protein